MVRRFGKDVTLDLDLPNMVQMDRPFEWPLAGSVNETNASVPFGCRFFSQPGHGRNGGRVETCPASTGPQTSSSRWCGWSCTVQPRFALVLMGSRKFYLKDSGPWTEGFGCARRLRDIEASDRRSRSRDVAAAFVALRRLFRGRAANHRKRQIFCARGRKALPG